MTLPVALQLYSIRDNTEKDMIGTLEKVAAIGYKGVEFAGFTDIPAKRLKAELNRLGLKAVGSHTGIELLKEKLDEVIGYNLEIENKYIVLPWFDLRSREDYLKLAVFLDETGKKCKAAGLQLCYHNHDFEFKTFDGEYGLDILYNNTSPENLAAELDTGWVFFAGPDPAEYLNKFKGRCPLIHIKDFLNKTEKSFTELGTGIINIKSIIGAAASAGTEWIIVEQDACIIPSLESVKISYDNVIKML